MNLAITTIKHKQYPQLLAELDRPPKQLYVLGATLDDSAKITVVGTRKPSEYGKKVTKMLVSELAAAGLTIVSGLAHGIDSLSHQVALESGGKCIAVMAGGLDSIYPSSNRNLAIRILKQGGTLISEYPAGMPSLKQNFVARNRLQSGLSSAVLIIEASESSGTLITAQFAIDQNRTVLAVPGNITSDLSFGTNKLIQEGATPVTCAQDVLDALNINITAQKRAEAKGSNPAEQKLIELLRSGIIKQEELLIKSELDALELSMALTMLEVEDILHQPQPGMWYLK